MNFARASREYYIGLTYVRIRKIDIWRRKSDEEFFFLRILFRNACTQTVVLRRPSRERNNRSRWPIDALIGADFL